MNYKEYDRIQAYLGGVGDDLRQELRCAIDRSRAEDRVKTLMENVASIVSKSVDDIALLISRAMRASIE